MDFQEQWKEEIDLLISLLRKTELMETEKWGIPVFTHNKKNVAGVAGFKEHIAIWFYDGVFLNDPQNRLINASEGKTKALRQLRFTKEEGIDEKLVLFYLDQAVENAKKGRKWVPEKSTKEMEVPELLKTNFSSDKNLEKSFSDLTPYKQKEYIEYITEAKQDKTRVSRMEKIKPMILQGIGLHDKYR